MRRLAPSIATLLVLTGCTGSQSEGSGSGNATGTSFTEPFETHDPLPPGWTSVRGRWVIMDEPEAPSGDHVVEQRATARGSSHLLWAAGKGTFADAELSVKFRVRAGEQQAVGLVFRAVSDERHYVAAVDGVDEVLRVFANRPGSLEPLAGEATVDLGDGRTFHTLHVRLEGERIQASLDDQAPLTVTDRTYPSGHVGLWTRDDTVAQFDDVTVRV